MKPIRIYCVKCNKFRKFVNPENSGISNKTFVLSIICSKCDKNDERIFKEKESYEILKFFWINIVKALCISKKYVRRKDKPRI